MFENNDNGYKGPASLNVGDVSHPIGRSFFALLAIGAIAAAFGGPTHAVATAETPTLFQGPMQMARGITDFDEINGESANWYRTADMPINQMYFRSDSLEKLNFDDPRIVDYLSDNGELSYTVFDGLEIVDQGTTSRFGTDKVVGSNILFKLGS